MTTTDTTARQLRNHFSYLEHHKIYEILETLESDKQVALEGFDEPITYEACKRGSEGGGENIWVVFKYKNNLYRLTGYYDSYNGEEWGEGDIETVISKEKTITVYERA